MVSSSLPLRTTSNRVVTFLQSAFYLFEGWVQFFIPESWKQKDVRGQTVLITGAGSGLGQLFALRFARLGCKVVIWDVDERGMNKTVQTMKEAKLDVSQVYCFKINLADREAIYETAKRVREQIGQIDILINNAGVVSGKYLLDTPDDRIKLTFDVNALAHFYTVKAFLPEMVTRNSGHIVTIASIAGNVAGCMMADYHASKFANVGFDMALRMELGQAGLDGIHTTIVKPYFIDTGMFSGVQTGLIDMLQPDYVADRVVSGILANAQEIIIPHYFMVFFWLVNMFPSKCLVPMGNFLGGFEFMTHFTGRAASAVNSNSATATTSDKIREENNNNTFMRSKNEVVDKKSN